MLSDTEEEEAGMEDSEVGCVCMCACVHACVCACMSVCVCMCVCTCARVLRAGVSTQSAGFPIVQKGMFEHILAIQAEASR